MRTIPPSHRLTAASFTLLLASAFVLTLTGCGSDAETQNRVARLEVQVDEIAKRLERLGDQTHDLQLKLMALGARQQEQFQPGLLPGDPATATPYERALALLQEKEIRNRVLFGLSENDFVAGFLQVMGPNYVGQLNDLSDKRRELEIEVRGLVSSGVEKEHPRVEALTSELDLVKDRLLEEITQQKTAMQIDVQILREQVEALKPEEN
ncbi:MAG: hypothetical protein AAGK14_07220 [Verrucomicrobiota bacterium]